MQAHILILKQPRNNVLYMRHITVTIYLDHYLITHYMPYYFINMISDAAQLDLNLID